MIRFAWRRALESIPVLFVLSFVVFGLFKLVPGDYLSEMELNPTISRETVQKLRQDYGLGRSLPVQYWLWLQQVLKGDFGYSFAQRRPASDIVRERVGGTLILTTSAFLLALISALILAMISALNVGRWPDGLSLVLSLTGLSLPTVLASIGCLYVAYWTGWLPIGGADTWRHLILPSITLAIPSAAFLARTLRLELIDALDQPYVRAAAAKGLPDWKVVWHALRNAANPVISLAGVTLGGLLSGAVVVEKVFGWPGLGSLIVESLLARDLYVALDCVLLASLFVIAANFSADLLLALNDPRVRYR